jgi:hypothetical protein
MQMFPLPSDETQYTRIGRSGNDVLCSGLCHSILAYFKHASIAEEAR